MQRRKTHAKKADVYAVYDGREAARIIEPTEEGARVLPACPSLFENAKGASAFSPDRLIEYIFRFAAFLGDFTLTAVLFVFHRYGTALLALLRRGASFFGQRFSVVAETLLAFPYAVADDARDLRKKLSAIHLQAKNASRTVDSRAVYLRFFAQELKARRGVWRVLGNTAFPLLAVVFAVVVSVNLFSSGYALEVRLCGESLGYIENEQVFDEAKTHALSLLRASEETEAALQNSVPTFRLCRVKLTDLQNSAALCEKLLQSGDVALTHACGVFIDGSFLCAVRNEADAVSAFDRLLTAAQKKRRRRHGRLCRRDQLCRRAVSRQQRNAARSALACANAERRKDRRRDAHGQKRRLHFFHREPIRREHGAAARAEPGR